MPAATLAQITSVDWSLELGVIGGVVQGVADVDQCIRIILTTPKGSDPLRPTFGTDLWQYIDYPINAAIPALVREVTEAITLWEPRARLLSVAAAAGSESAQLVVTLAWELRLGSASAPAQITRVSIPGGAGAGR